MKNNGAKLLIGGVLILLGILFLLDQFGLSRYLNGHSLIGFFWPVLVIAIGVMFLARGGITAGIIFLFFGGLFFASQLFGWEIWGTWWPLILIALGVAILLGKTIERPGLNVVSGGSSTSQLNDFIAFWGAEKRITSKEFTGGKITCLFGGEKIDLREAEIAKDGGKLEISTAFGGVELIVPQNMNIEVKGNAILGGVDNKTAQQYSEAAGKGPLLTIICSVAFGGIEVKN
jgi:predicted membrane protein